MVLHCFAHFCELRGCSPCRDDPRRCAAKFLAAWIWLVGVPARTASTACLHAVAFVEFCSPPPFQWCAALELGCRRGEDGPHLERLLSPFDSCVPGTGAPCRSASIALASPCGLVACALRIHFFRKCECLRSSTLGRLSRRGRARQSVILSNRADLGRSPGTSSSLGV